MIKKNTYWLELKSSGGDSLFADNARDDELYLPSDSFRDTELRRVVF